MTIAELVRAIESKKRARLNDLRDRAQFDYIMADLIGLSVSRIYGGKYPSLLDSYPSLFDNEEYKIQQEEKKNELSALRFKQFVNSYNKRFIRREQEINE